MTTMLVLPKPPALNNLFFNVPGKGRAKSDDYKRWRSAAGWELKRQRPRIVTGEYALDIFVPKSRRDADSWAKSVCDLLVEHGVTPDDKHARRVATEVIETLPADEVHCIVRPWSEVGRIADQFAFPVQMEGKR